MSDQNIPTPRTDAEAFVFHQQSLVLSDFARQLERELADAESREAHNLEIAINEAKVHKARADRWEKVAEHLWKASTMDPLIDGYHETFCKREAAIAAYDAAKKGDGK